MRWMNHYIAHPKYRDNCVSALRSVERLQPFNAGLFNLYCGRMDSGRCLRRKWKERNQERIGQDNDLPLRVHIKTWCAERVPLCACEDSVGGERARRVEWADTGRQNEMSRGCIGTTTERLNSVIVVSTARRRLRNPCLSTLRRCVENKEPVAPWVTAHAHRSDPMYD